jgi:hypothetical protein
MSGTHEPGNSGNRGLMRLAVGPCAAGGTTSTCFPARRLRGEKGSRKSCRIAVRAGTGVVCYTPRGRK